MQRIKVHLCESHEAAALRLGDEQCRLVAFNQTLDCAVELCGIRLAGVGHAQVIRDTSDVEDVKLLVERA